MRYFYFKYFIFQLFLKVSQNTAFIPYRIENLIQSLDSNAVKTALEKAQKDHENSTIQYQKVVSKSIITITKGENKVLAMIEIYQNWKLDTLEKRGSLTISAKFE